MGLRTAFGPWTVSSSGAGVRGTRGSRLNEIQMSVSPRSSRPTPRRTCALIGRPALTPAEWVCAARLATSTVSAQTKCGGSQGATPEQLCWSVASRRAHDVTCALRSSSWLQQVSRRPRAQNIRSMASAQRQLPFAGSAFLVGESCTDCKRTGTYGPATE